MNSKLSDALANIETGYQSIVEIANDMLLPILDPVNKLIEEINIKAVNMSIDQIRDFILRLQLKAFEISEVKEKSALKADLAEAIQKEKQAVEFNKADGTAAVKSNIAIINVSAEITAEALYNLVANLLKTKLDQLHRLTDALKSILMSRMQEQKFMNIGTDSEVPGTTNGKVVLNEMKGF